MATLEDKILGEKLHNYCSSSEESDGEDDSNSDSEKRNKQQGADAAAAPEDVGKWEGTSQNTGPKGVIKDWQRFKQLECEKRADQDAERIELAKKLTLTVQSALDEEKEKAALDDPDLSELLNDDILLQFQKQRMQELLNHNRHDLKFGKLISLRNGQEYLDAIDKENKSVTVVVHIYEDYVEACRTMNACLTELAKMYEGVKFCAIVGSQAGMSKEFKVKGVPALLVYKAGQLIGNFIRMSDDLGRDFYPEDVQGYLIEHGLLEDRSCVPRVIRNDCEEDSD